MSEKECCFVQKYVHRRKERKKGEKRERAALPAVKMCEAFFAKSERAVASSSSANLRDSERQSRGEV